jgi:peptide/nickel transport system substrate-binding protein
MRTVVESLPRHMLNLLCLVLAVVMLGCATPRSGPAAGSAGQAGSTSSDGAARFKRITAAVRADLPTVSKTLNTIIPGATALDRLVSAGLTTSDDQGVQHPQLAEATPSLENGLWKVFPDGHMELTWKLKPGVQWHDGTPVTADDLLFAVRVGQDRELLLFNHPGFTAVDRVEAVDSATVLVYWKQPFIDADAMFGHLANDDFALPLPRHILEKVYLEDKTAFAEHPYWSNEFVGTGPFRVREWTKGSSVTVTANERYVLGRPKIDEIEIKFIPDGNTLMANLLAGSVDVTIGERNFSLDEATQIQWPDGAWVPGDRSPIVAFPQLLNPTPAINTNVQFRRALVHAVDRQEMANIFQPGLALVAHPYISPDLREFKEVESAAVRYDFDLRRTAQILESLGYTRGADGTYVDAAGARLVVEIRSTTLSENNKSMLSVADYWTRAGIAAEPHTIPLARSQEAEYRSNFPGWELIRQPKLEVITRIHSSRARLPANNYRTIGGFNYPRYLNPEYDAMIDRFYSTVPWEPRMDALREIVRHASDQVIVMGTFYSTEANMRSNRLEGVLPTRAWAAHQWDVKG